MKKFLAVLMTAVFTAGLVAVMFPADANAIPAFARQTGENCFACHYAFPKLNEKGKTWKYYGYRFAPDKGENVWDLETVPVAFVIEVMGMAKWGDQTNMENIKVEEVEIMMATSMGKNFSVFGEIKCEDGDCGAAEGKLEWDNIGGNKSLNVAVGDLAADFPHLAVPRRIIHQSYLAQNIGGLRGGAGGEVNGQVLSTGTISSYRYNAGFLKPEDEMVVMTESNMINSLYGTLTLGVLGQHNIGLQYRYTDEGDMMLGKNYDVHRIAANVELNFGPLTLTGAYFYADYDAFGGSLASLTAHDFMGEILYKLAPNWILGVREEYLMADQGSMDGNMNNLTAGVYYYPIPNIHIFFEYRNEQLNDLDADLSLATSDITNHTAMIMAVAGF